MIRASLRAYGEACARAMQEAAAECAEKPDFRHQTARAEIAGDIRKLEIEP